MKKILVFLCLIGMVSYASVSWYSDDQLNQISLKFCKTVEKQSLTRVQVHELFTKLGKKHPRYSSILNTLEKKVIFNCYDEDEDNTVEINTPKWIYVSAGPTNERSYSVKENLLQYDHVDGVLVRITWNDIETAKWVYDFSKINYQLDLVKQYDKKIALTVLIDTPDWFKNEENSVYYTSVRDNAQRDMPIPWNQEYLDTYELFISELSTEYKDEESIGLLYITNWSFNGVEMQFPREVTPEQIWYTNEKIIDSWKKVIDMYNVYFPNTFLANDYHPIFENDEPSQEIYEYAIKTLGNRYWASMWWWSERNMDTYSKQNDILNESVSHWFAWVQFAQSWTKNPDKLSNNWFTGLVDLTLDKWVCYFEIWENDIKNNEFISDFENIQESCK